MSKKIRTIIPDGIAAELLFLSDRTCCICNIRGKRVQIHHIDGDPNNNIIDNLSVLCFDCHDQTLISGGFGRKLDSNQINKYRNDWIERVKIRKAKADEFASLQAVTGMMETSLVIDGPIDDSLNYKTNVDPTLLEKYLNEILKVHQAQMISEVGNWNSGTTAIMNQGNYDMVDFYEEVLIELATFYPKRHFNNPSPKEYFNKLISSKFLWYRLAMEPRGIGTGGTIISTMVGSYVMNDLKNMIVEMVNTLHFVYELDKQIVINEWKKEWLR